MPGAAAVATVVAIVLAALMLAAGPQSAQGDPAIRFRGLDGTVAPREAVPDSVRPQRIIFRFRASGRVRVELRIRKLTAGSGPGRLIARRVTGPLEPGRWHRRFFRGFDRKGRLAAPGRYSVRIGAAGGKLRTLSRIQLHGHRFPVRGPHGVRGYIGEFGAPRTGGRTHEGFDVTAACGTPLVAPRSSIVLRNAYDAELKGYYVVLKGRAERRTYLYAHLIRRAPVTVGQKLRAGRRVGSVGQTGNAWSTPCHLHFEVRTRGRLLDPGPLLGSWLR
jgi:murein DD-endopeptidase MepM/ murein hydrolase activator NlpD